MRLFYSCFFCVILIIATSACSSNEAIGRAFNTRVNAGPCPVAGSLYDSARLVRFADGAERRMSNIIYTGEITDVAISCRYVDADPIEVKLEMELAFGRGEAANANTADYTYFVAVTRPNGRVLNKVENTINVRFGQSNIVSMSEIIEPIVIPRADASVSGANFEILVGFALSEEELQFNRDGRRFLLSPGR